MRFKDKDGYVHTSSELMRVSFCSGDCSGCAINQPGSCWYFVHQHPEEAARLMGYEVVADEEKVNTVTDRHRSKEANMDKQGKSCTPVEASENIGLDLPHICEVLGVEVGEPFSVGGYGTYEIDAYGQMWYLDGCGAKVATCDVLCEIIGNPNQIIRQPRFTEEEVADARAIRRLHPDREEIRVYRLHAGELFMDASHGSV